MFVGEHSIGFECITKKGTREMNEPCLKCGEYHNRCFELKELTDAEIIKLFENDELWTRSSIVYQDDAIDFARAILRKAQEK
jgi:hypothetical protein